MTHMVIVMDGGLIDHILADAEVVVLIKDYDTEGADAAEINTDEVGEEYVARHESITLDEGCQQSTRIKEIFDLDDTQMKAKWDKRYPIDTETHQKPSCSSGLAN